MVGWCLLPCLLAATAPPWRSSRGLACRLLVGTPCWLRVATMILCPLGGCAFFLLLLLLLRLVLLRLSMLRLSMLRRRLPVLGCRRHRPLLLLTFRVTLLLSPSFPAGLLLLPRLLLAWRAMVRGTGPGLALFEQVQCELHAVCVRVLAVPGGRVRLRVLLFQEVERRDDLRDQVRRRRSGYLEGVKDGTDDDCRWHLFL